MSLEQVNIRDVLADEIRTLEAIFKTKREAMEPIILSAAKKLEAYYLDQTQICVVLIKNFPKDAERDVRRFCPSKYKHQYVIEEQDKAPIDLLDEALKLMEDVLGDAITIIGSIRDKYRAADVEERKELNTFIINIFGGVAELKKRVDYWKDASVTLANIKQMHDERQKLDNFTKFLLKIQSFYMSKNEMGKLAGISSKWVKHGIERNFELEHLAQLIFSTDAKYAKIATWFNEQKIRLERNMELLPLPGESAED